MMPEVTERQPVFDLAGNGVIQVGIVVRDAQKTARRFSDIFGIGTWVFYDTLGTDLVLHGKSEPDCCLRLAFANLGRMQIELLQPLSGPSSHMEFLHTRGEGVHHLSFGSAVDRATLVSTLSRHGIEVEMAGLVESASPFAYMATQEALGTIYEVVDPIAEEAPMKPWGIYEPQGPGLINMEGKEILQVGIVTDDVEKMARNYWEIFGVGPWTFFDFKSPYTIGTSFQGIPMIEESQDLYVKAAFANIGSLQIELLQPVSGASTLLDFLQTHGAGIHHLSFDVVGDHDETVAAVVKHGIGIEMQGRMGDGLTFTYLDTQKELGAVFELVDEPEGFEYQAPVAVYPPGQQVEGELV